MHPRTAARRGALKALVAMEGADRPLSAVLSARHLAAESRPFANEIATGTLRQRAWIDYTLTPLLKKPLSAQDAPVRSALRLAAYEKYFLQTPAAAISHEYAGLMRGEKLTSAVAFVNAVVRRLPDQLRPVPDPQQDPVAHLAIRYSHPEWLVERWLKRLGLDGCAALCQANNRIAPLALRVNTLRATREDILTRFNERGMSARAGSLSPDAILVEQAGDPTQWPEWQEGLIIAQDEAAQLAGLLAAPQAGQTVLDAAAAPGGKTTHLAQLMGDSGQIIACDLAPGRLKLIEENARRLKIQTIQTRAGDFRELAGGLPPADLVLLDAPCLGTGTLRRRPDAKWRKTPAQLEELVALQRSLLEAAGQRVRPGGILVYATCSLEPEENAEQAHWWLHHHPGWKLEPPVTTNAVTADSSTADAITGDPILPSLRANTVMDESFLHTQPHIHDTDGMFAARFRRLQ